VVLLQVVAAILLILGSLLILRAVSLADVNPGPSRGRRRPVLVAKGRPSRTIEGEGDWRKAA
jgi:hypothetical protein